ncbi:MAG TPA: dihydroorotate dehydrogenase [Terriglobales bacterium]|nr:dihydroorotate dehydrogenase [Terriglobales bacterium]
MDLSVDIAGLRLQNPILAASGTFGYGTEFEDIVNLAALGAVVTKGLSRQPMAGNPSPRLFETSAGMLNSVGLQNIGAEAFVQTRLPRLRQLGVVVIANVFGESVEEYLDVIGILNQGEGVAAYEINASCPNTRHGGMVFGTDAGLLAELVSAAKRVSRRPVIVKLSPNVTSIAAMARAAEAAGADALSLVNTFLGMAINAETRRPRFARVVAGLSGPAIKPLALRMVYEAHQAVGIPLIGLGGIATAQDAVEFLLAGAAAVQIGTMNFWDPKATENVLAGLRQFCRRHGIEAVRGLTGALELGAPGADVAPGAATETS